MGLVFPNICPLCLKDCPVEGVGVCNSCHGDLPYIKGQTCEKCGGPLLTDYALCRECQDTPRIWWQSAASAFCFEGTARSIVHRFKYHGDVTLVPLLANACLEAWKQHYPDRQIDCIVPVPLHWVRALTRGYNQSHMISAELSKSTGIPVNRFLKRVRWTPPQATLSKSGRRKNLKNAFVVRDVESVSGKRIILLDDVMTTGTTLNECSRLLVKAGATEVNILTIARRL